MFLIALFYTLQYPGDDGSCSANDKARCMAVKSALSWSHSRCEWLSDDGTAGRCSWVATAPADLEIRGLVLAIVIAVAIPINAIIHSVFTKYLAGDGDGSAAHTQRAVKTANTNTVTAATK